MYIPEDDDTRTDEALEVMEVEETEETDEETEEYEEEEGSEEDGGVGGLGLIPGRCVRFDPALDPSAKIPHMGWNTLLRADPPHPLLAGLADGEAFYFVHSYHAGETPAAAGWTDYCGVRFPSAVAAGSLFATQFHPERSGQAGAALLHAFLAWAPGKEGPCC